MFIAIPAKLPTIRVYIFCCVSHITLKKVLKTQNRTQNKVFLPFLGIILGLLKRLLRGINPTFLQMSNAIGKIEVSNNVFEIL